MPRRFRRWPSGWTILAIALLAAAALRTWWPGHEAQGEGGVVSAHAGTEVALAAGQCQIVKSVNGNTLLVSQGDGKQFRVRLLGVTADGDPRAPGELAKLAPPGPGWIELDKRRAAGDGAWLAYLYVGERLVNAEILRAGYGRYESYPGDSSSHGRQLREAQAAARQDKRGQWAQPVPTQHDKRPPSGQ
jgi:micrococcal nuclease